MRALILSAALLGACAARAEARPPIIDMHMHALAADEQGPPPLAMCTPMGGFPAWDPRRPYPEQFFDILRHPR